MDLKITKRNLERLPFVPEKYITSLKRCGADDTLAQELCEKLQRESRDNLSTRHIFNRTRQRLKHRYPLLYTNYGLAQALMRLGPDGFAFERYISLLFQRLGYKTQVGLTQHGRCISHEVDMIAKNDKISIYAECKFHNRRAYKNDIKMALYVRGRWLDLKENPQNKIDEFWLISNTKFTSDAIQYGTCSGMKLLGSNFPEERNLLMLIQQYRHYPITVLTSLHEHHFNQLQQAGVYLLQELIDHPQHIAAMNLSEQHHHKLSRELQAMRDFLKNNHSEQQA